MVKPYLKWVGGKTQLAKDLIKRFPESFDRYIEPFCGSAALFFAFYDRFNNSDIFETKKPVKAVLNDVNQALLNCHREVAYHPDAVRELCDKHESEHKKDPEGYYRKIRSLVNTVYGRSAEQSASDFIYINKTCFNGLWRVNSKGVFNVPFNGKAEISLYNGNFNKCSALLRTYGQICHGDFYTLLLSHARKGDFVFLDPPYIPLSVTSSFTGYTEGGWDGTFDAKLLQILEFMDGIGVKFMMTNSSAPRVYDLFGKWNITEVKAHRFVKAISSDGEKRHKVDETITTNY